MKVVSVNVGLPRLLTWKGSSFQTGILKKAISGRIPLRATNLDGDRQADLTVHGGPSKAVYGYPSEHYPYWRAELLDHTLEWGALGENFTTEGMLETQVSIGDRYRVGSAVVMVRTPRLPCFKLAAKFQRDDIIERFLDSGHSGYYFSVVEEGEVGGGDDFEFLGGEAFTITIAEMCRLYISASADLASLERAMRVRIMPESWRERFQARIAAMETAT
jgi:MOSC domain-containing protein YiiM